MKNITKIATVTTCSVSLIIGMVLSHHADEIQTSKQGLDIIGNAENCLKQPYYCPANILTVGIGSTGHIESRTYTDNEIAERWVNDIKQAEQCINQHANGSNLPQSVFDAVVSITFNVGCTKMKTSTLYYYLNQQDYHSACNEFPRWNKAAGKVLNGLIVRRNKERELCLTDLN